MRHTKRQNLTARFQRFQIGEPQVSVIVKNARSRCACFWFGLSNLSASGVGLEYIGYGHVPFSQGDVLHLTIDTSCAVFKRPIHLKAVIRRREEEKHEDNSGAIRVFLGAEITSVDTLHESVWLEGLGSLGDPFKMETVGERKKSPQKPAQKAGEEPAALAAGLFEVA